MTPPPRIPTGSGVLSEFARWTIDSIRALQPIPTPGLTTSAGPRGVSLRPIKAPTSKPAASSPQAAVVLAVLPNHLVVDMGLVPSFDITQQTLVQKPWSLHVHGLPETDTAVLATFRAGGGTPGPTVNWGWFTQDYLMRGDTFIDRLDGVDLSVYGGDPPAYPSTPWTGGAQSRLRLVHAPARDFDNGFSGPVTRFEMREVVWPPYVPLNGIGGIGGGNYSTILVQNIPGYGWLDLNVDARHWADLSVTSGQSMTLTPDGGSIGRTTVESQRFF